LAAYPATIPPPRITNLDALIHPPLRTIDPLIFSLRLLFSTSGLPEIPAQSVKVRPSQPGVCRSAWWREAGRDSGRTPSEIKRLEKRPVSNELLSVTAFPSDELMQIPPQNSSQVWNEV
jgi:hypothetical protein